jgi:hypothetical protein
MFGQIVIKRFVVWSHIIIRVFALCVESEMIFIDFEAELFAGLALKRSRISQQ